MQEDICRNNHGGNPESEAANVVTNKERDRGRVIEFISSRGLYGTTCDSLEQRLGISHQTASARCSDLLKDGIIMRKPVPGMPDKYEKRPTRTGKSAAVLVMAPR